MSSLSTSPWLLYALLGLITLVLFQMTSVVIYHLVNYSAVHYDILIIYIITSAFLANLFHQVRDNWYYSTAADSIPTPSSEPTAAPGDNTAASSDVESDVTASTEGALVSEVVDNTDELAQYPWQHQRQQELSVKGLDAHTAKILGFLKSVQERISTLEIRFGECDKAVRSSQNEFVALARCSRTSAQKRHDTLISSVAALQDEQMHLRRSLTDMHALQNVLVTPPTCSIAVQTHFDVSPPALADSDPLAALDCTVDATTQTIETTKTASIAVQTDAPLVSKPTPTSALLHYVDLSYASLGSVSHEVPLVVESSPSRTCAQAQAKDFVPLLTPPTTPQKLSAPTFDHAAESVDRQPSPSPSLAILDEPSPSVLPELDPSPPARSESATDSCQSPTHASSTADTVSRFDKVLAALREAKAKATLPLAHPEPPSPALPLAPPPTPSSDTPSPSSRSEPSAPSPASEIPILSLSRTDISPSSDANTNTVEAMAKTPESGAEDGDVAEDQDLSSKITKAETLDCNSPDAPVKAIVDCPEPEPASPAHGVDTPSSPSPTSLPRDNVDRVEDQSVEPPAATSTACLDTSLPPSLSAPPRESESNTTSITAEPTANAAVIFDFGRTKNLFSAAVDGVRQQASPATSSSSSVEFSFGLPARPTASPSIAARPVRGAPRRKGAKSTRRASRAPLATISSIAMLDDYYSKDAVIMPELRFTPDEGRTGYSIANVPKVIVDRLNEAERKDGSTKMMFEYWYEVFTRSELKGQEGMEEMALRAPSEVEAKGEDAVWDWITE